ncbi:uncharacterized protein Z520_11198 [Fonsecaea multimorphosa CBS 102226]|uniref:Uncharacterized protein n=1 Tax=Fonsecaea multimorphosa CBS 102226 TaxID=1442371 RepID=A0A0D2I7E0_9EURO|nr:uncharacterized protein Z520_11198 [Fonsecaea multimorphosa CBS 102226]KIX93141.1 hypothetical protein Z520_11198 [Fonsecaea multimorphosa CBS 102226]
MSSDENFDNMSDWSTSKVQENYSYLYPTSGAGSREVEFLDRYRENVSYPPTDYSRNIDEKIAASTLNDSAARDREALGSAGRDFAYDSSDSRHWDSKLHPR